MRYLTTLTFCFAAPLMAQSPATIAAPVDVEEEIDAEGRLKWAVTATLGAPNLAGGLFKAGFQTLIDDPEEWDTHWKGFGQRYALRLSGNATSNLMEAGLGAAWGEDPRYHRVEASSTGGRVWNVVKTTFTATNSEGRTVPAYARLVAVPVGNTLTNAWRPDSQRTVAHTVGRISIGFVSRMASNAFYEFWPDVKKHVFRMGD